MASLVAASRADGYGMQFDDLIEVA